ncbi:hypothetical protein [Mesorhizobium marinum]
MSETSAWDLHRQAQRQHVIDREYQRQQREAANKEYEAELRRRCAVQRGDQSPYESDVREARSAARKLADGAAAFFSFGRR